MLGECDMLVPVWGGGIVEWTYEGIKKRVNVLFNAKEREEERGEG
jgi:hypothetical protein